MRYIIQLLRFLVLWEQCITADIGLMPFNRAGLSRDAVVKRRAGMAESGKSEKVRHRCAAPLATA